MRKALIVGIDFYNNFSLLHGCVNDAYSVKSTLDRNINGTINFDTKLIVSSNSDSKIKASELKNNIKDLFESKSEVALFYFAGHGYIDTYGGYLLTSDNESPEDGISLDYLIKIINKSNAKNKVIILDSCHSGLLGENTTNNITEIASGVTILTASSKEQYASEEKGSGVFTNLFVDALQGSAANLLGQITPGSIYAHIDQALGAWQQRPIFKTNVENFISLRDVTPPIDIANLLKITEFFKSESDEFLLDPTYEPKRDNTDLKDLPEPIDKHVEIFKVLQSMNRVNLIVPVNAEHMYYAAMKSKSCKLTPLGMHYWNIVNSGRI